MTGGKKARPWKDRSGTEWFVQRRENEYGRKPGWILRRVGYSLVVYTDPTQDPTAAQLQGWIDGHMAAGGGGEGVDTARLWIDTRNRTEWEISEEGHDLVFHRGYEKVRFPRGYGRTPPRSMEDDALQAALDEGRPE
jgi:hypothetical protein